MKDKKIKKDGKSKAPKPLIFKTVGSTVSSSTQDPEAKSTTSSTMNSISQSPLLMPQKCAPTTAQTTPEKIRRLDFSPSKSPFKSPSNSSNFVDLHGYVSSYHSDQSKAGNAYTDLNVQIKTTESAKIRIMHNSNPGITVNYIKELKLSGSPYHFSNLSPSASEIYFFSSFRNSRISISNEVDFQFFIKDKIEIKDVKLQTAGCFDILACITWLSEKTTPPSNSINTLREAVAYDHTGNIPLTVWGNQIDEIGEDKWYTFTQLNLKNYFEVRSC